MLALGGLIRLHKRTAPLQIASWRFPHLHSCGLDAARGLSFCRPFLFLGRDISIGTWAAGPRGYTLFIGGMTIKSQDLIVAGLDWIGGVSLSASAVPRR